MAHAILMPKPGQMTEECTVVAWHKREGDPVVRGDILFEIETDKSTMEVEAFDDGVLLRIVAPEGAVVPVNTVCGYVGTAGEEVPAGPPVAIGAATAPEVPGNRAPAGAPSPTPGSATAPTPLVTAGAGAPPARTGTPSPAARLAISPRARRLAAEVGLDPRSVAGSGPSGRIIERDVRRAMKAVLSPHGEAAPAPPLPGAEDGEDEPRPLSRLRRVIAERLTQSWTTIPHFSVTVTVDVTALLALRAELRTAGTSLTVTDFVLAATARTLAEFPDVNSRTDGLSVWNRRRVHLGLAVAIPGGLVVPVIRDADRLGIGELHERAGALAAAARQGTLAVDDMTGSTFTVSNLGMHGVDEFSAIINPGEAAILAVASAVPTAVAIGDGLAVRSIAKLTLSADHRLVDGELAARFLGGLRRRLEDAPSFRTEALYG
jgi:pyruvate dehydrogenase E2 component (dihydrolipoamide acetyltransferase)